MGRGVYNSWRRAWRNIAVQGCIELQLNNIQMQFSQKCNYQPAFFLSHTMLHCLKLVEEDVLCCSAKVCKLTEIQGGDCGDDRKSYHLRVHVKNICALKIRRSNLHHTLWATTAPYTIQCYMLHMVCYICGLLLS
jgi:hypothetical protein